MANRIPISDLDIPELKVYIHLTEAQLRSCEDVFIAETPTVIEGALNAGCVPISFLLDEDHATGTATALLERCPHVPAYVAKAELIQSLTGYALTRGVLCAMKRPKHPEVQSILRSSRRVAVLDGIADPSNLGAIFRNAAALGMDGILLTQNCVDPLYRRAVRVSMGTVFMIPWARMHANWMSELKTEGFKLAAMALSNQSVSVCDSTLKHTERLAIVLGNEGKGLSSDVIEQCDYTVMIPMHHGVDSLNVAAASAIAFWEMRKE